MFFNFRSVREHRRAQAAAAAGAQPIGHVAGDDDQQPAAGQRELQRERTPDADGPQRQTVQRSVQPLPQEKGHQPVDMLFYQLQLTTTGRL